MKKAILSIKEKTGFILSALLIIILLGLIAFSSNGISDYKKLAQKEKEIIAQIQIVERKNRKLAGEINRIKTDAEYLKHLARHEYNMVEKDEYVFKYIQNGKEKKND